MKRYLDLCEPGRVQQFLRSWSELYVRPDSYPLTLADAQEHADAFMSAAKSEGISQRQIVEAVRGHDLGDVMVLRMRNCVEQVLSAAG